MEEISSTSGLGSEEVSPPPLKTAKTNRVVLPKQKPVYVPALRELLDWLCISRKLLAIFYLTALAVWMALSLYGMDVLFSDFAAAIEVSVSGDPSNSNMGGIHLIRLGVIAGLCALQALFLFGGGKISVQPRSVRLYRMSASVIIFAALMALICVGFAACYLELANIAIEWEPNSTILCSVGAVWLFWIGIGLVALRKTDQARGLSRLIICLLAGSWVEFAVALPINLVARDRHEDCPCASGSWFALLLCGPILFWSIGPAIFLLFLREKRACQRDPRHSRRILLERTVRGG